MYELSVRNHFSAAHCLIGYDGKCAARHGHNWEVTVFVKGKEVDEIGMLVDFHVLKQTLKDTLAGLDHTDLNTLPVFASRNPTSENIARHVYSEFVTRLKGRKCLVDRVTVAETPENVVTYCGERRK